MWMTLPFSKKNVNVRVRMCRRKMLQRQALAIGLQPLAGRESFLRQASAGEGSKCNPNTGKSCASLIRSWYFHAPAP